MKNKKIFSFLMAISILVSVFAVIAVPASAAELADVEANAVYLVEKNTGKVLYTKNEEQKIAPASTTKTLTVLCALQAMENGKMSEDTVITVPDGVYFDVPAEGSTAGLDEGYELTMKELIYCALLPSANEACNTIAIAVSGSVESFVSLMNSTAKELGCTGSHFANTHGLPNDDHYVTAKDLSLILSKAVEYPLFNEISHTAAYTIPANSTHDAIELENTNRLLDEEDKYYTSACTAGKTGYTDAAGYCLISAAEDTDTGLSLICVVMGGTSTLEDDGSTKVSSFTVTRQLYDWAFSSFSYRDVLLTSELLAELPVHLGTADTVLLCPDAVINALLENDLPDSEIKKEVHLNTELVEAPVLAGDILGTVTVSCRGETLGTVSLVANSSVTVSKPDYIKAEISKMVHSTLFRVILILLIVMFILYTLFVVRYNRIRKMRRRNAIEKARREAMETNRRAESTTNKTFEEIEAMYAKDR